MHRFHHQFDLMILSFGNGNDANYVNCGVIAYLRQHDEYGSNAAYIEVYEDYILVRGRDIVSSKWIANAQYVIYKN